MTPEPIDAFIENLLQQAGLSNLPADYKAVYVEKLKEQINRRLSVMIMENLDEATAKALAEKLIDPKNFNLEKLQGMLIEQIPDFAEKVKNEMSAFAEEFVKAAQPK